MTPVAPLLFLLSLALIAAGLSLLASVTREGRELSPAELSTSAPAVRSCWARMHELAARRRAAPRRVRSGPRAVVLEMAEISAARTLLCGRIADLCRSSDPG
jgi:hypothetical protein